MGGMGKCDAPVKYPHRVSLSSHAGITENLSILELAADLGGCQVGNRASVEEFARAGLPFPFLHARRGAAEQIEAQRFQMNRITYFRQPAHAQANHSQHVFEPAHGAFDSRSPAVAV